MKKNAIVRIVVWSVVALILINLLISALASDTFGKIPVISLTRGGFFWADSDKYTDGGGEADSSFRKIEIDWASGGVEVRPYDGDTLKFDETGGSEDGRKMQYRLHDGTLYIRYCKPHFAIFSLGWFGKNGNKQLTVLIPRDVTLEKLDVDAASADVRTADIIAEEITVSSASGTVDFTNVKAENLGVDTASGDINLSAVSGKNLSTNTVSGKTTAENCTFAEIDADTVSGDFTYAGTADSISADSTSGGVSVTVPAHTELDFDTVSGSATVNISSGEPDFRLSFDTVSGDVSCNFATVSKNGDIVCGGGDAKYDIDTVSGGVMIIAAG